MPSSNAVNRLARPHFDWPLCLSAYALALFGVLAVSITNFDPSLGNDRSLLQLISDSPNGSLQAIFVIISPLALGAMLFFSYRIFGRIWPIMYVVICIVLALVLTMSAISGTRGWFVIESLRRTVQPSELAKIIITISLSSELSRHEKSIPNWKYFVRILIHIGIPLILITLQPDIGTMLVFIVIFMTLLLASGCSLKLWFGILIVGIAACIPIGMYLQSTRDFRWLRLVSFIDPSSDETAGYQIIHSKLAVGAGGWSGVGMFVAGTLTHLNFVPENHTDFIFSAIGETMGFVGCIALLSLYAFMFYRMLLLAINTPDRFGRLIIMGVMSMLLFHVFENIGMNIGVMPITGIPLPFVSYGGSNLIANMAGIGLVLNVTQRKQGARKRR